MKTLIADKFPQAHLGRIVSLGCDVAYHPGVSIAELPALAADAEILVVRGKKVTTATLEAAHKLALVLRAGAGVNTIDTKTASARGIFISNCPGKNSIAVAELVFALLLAIDRRIPDNTATLRAGLWNKKEFSRADGVYGKTLGVIGAGSIGREVIRRAQAFGLRVMAWDCVADAGGAAELGVKRCENVDDIFREADIVTLHLVFEAGNAQTGQCRPPGADEAARDPDQHLARRSGGPGRFARGHRGRAPSRRLGRFRPGTGRRRRPVRRSDPEVAGPFLRHAPHRRVHRAGPKRHRG